MVNSDSISCIMDSCGKGDCCSYGTHTFIKWRLKCILEEIRHIYYRKSLFNFNVDAAKKAIIF